MTSLVDLYRSQTNEPHDAILEVLFRADSSSRRDMPFSVDLSGGKDGRGARSSTSLFNKRLNESDIRQIVEIFTSSKRPLVVEDLDLSYNRIGDIGTIEIAKLISSSSPARVKRIRLRSNNISAKGVEALAAALAKSKDLILLDINDNPIGRRGGFDIVKALEGNSTLAHLDLGNTEIDADVVIKLADYVLNNSKSSALRFLNLSNVRKRRRGSDIVTHWIGKMIKASETLESVCLQKMDLDDSSLSILVDYLLNNKTLRRLDVSRNRIGSDGVLGLARLMSDGRCAIENLDLASNKIGDKGAMALSVSISDDVGLKALNIGHNGIGPKGLIAVANAMYRNSRIEKLRVWGNRFDHDSAAAFATYTAKESDRGALLDITTRVVDETCRVACNGGTRT